MTLSILADLVGKSKPSGSPQHAVPSHLFKEIFPSIGQLVLNINAIIWPELFLQALNI